MILNANKIAPVILNTRDWQRRGLGVEWAWYGRGVVKLDADAKITFKI